jgi:hypothetical protein
MEYGFTAPNTSRARIISGASMAQLLRHMDVPARAIFGAEIYDGNVIVQNLTAKSIAALVGVSVASLFAAMRLDVKRGLRPLILPRQPAPPVPVEDAWCADSYAGRLAFTLRHASELLAMLDNITAPTVDSNIVITDMRAAA